jgi:ABC-type branched-subunit amino acid transport system ATPase component
VARIISELKQAGFSILLVEHNMRAIMSICQRIVVLHHGEKLSETDPKSQNKGHMNNTNAPGLPSVKFLASNLTIQD